MRDYLVIETPPGYDATSLDALATRLVASADWRTTAQLPNCLVLTERLHPPRVTLLPAQSGVLIGDVFDAKAAREGRAWPFEVHGLAGLGQADEIAEHLVENAFGRYLAVLTAASGPALYLRDPIGVLEAASWRREGLTFVGSRLPPDQAIWPEDLAVDWDAVADILRQKSVTSDRTPLKGLANLPAGVLAPAGGPGRRLWSPGRFARNRSDDVTPAALARTIDGVTAAWALGRPTILCEVSGGIDSAIVASALRAAGAKMTAIHHHWPQVEADERGFAQAVAERVDAELTCVSRATLVLDAAKLEGAAGGFRPSYIAGDPDHDADLAARLDDGRVALFTGRAGDAVFFQMPAAELAGDLLRGLPASIPRLKALERLAHRRGRTVWNLAAEALGGWSAPLGWAPSPSFLTDQTAARAPAAHSWLAELGGVTPAKRVQIRSIVNNLSAFGESLRHRAGDVIDPLLSQPLLEQVLAVPAPRLALGPADRPFARAAFAERLPPQILNRRGKGDLAVFYSQSLAASLDFLRPYLLDGMLARQGLIDRDRLDPLLSSDSLIWADQVSEIFVALAVESWARVWSARSAQVMAARRQDRSSPLARKRSGRTDP